MRMSSIEEKARKARDKKALFGTDVNLESYQSELSMMHWICPMW